MEGDGWEAKAVRPGYVEVEKKIRKDQARRELQKTYL